MISYYSGIIKSFTMTKILVLIASVLGMGSSYSQNIGIGTNNPKARLHVADSSVLFTANAVLPVSPNDPPVVGPGIRMMWYADKAALRAGGVNGPHWDKLYIGNYSFAAGFNVAAEGASSIAMGTSCEAGGDESITIGRACVAYGIQAIAIGRSCASTGPSSVAIGFGNSSSGDYSVALGSEADALGDYGVAIGNNVTANGIYSTALGSYVSTSGFEGSLAIGDHSTTTIMGSFVANGFRSRFAGGYRLFTNSAVTVGAFLNANANSWAALSDVRMKENFLAVDGESFLQKIAAMPQFTWNYIGQDVKTLRHYGPMAQDFYQAFGKDDLGEIGCDTMINQQDFLGVNLIAIQALEKRTTEMQKKLDKTNELLENYEQRIAALEEQNRLLRHLLKHKVN